MISFLSFVMMKIVIFCLLVLLFGYLSFYVVMGCPQFYIFPWSDRPFNPVLPFFIILLFSIMFVGLNNHVHFSRKYFKVNGSKINQEETKGAGEEVKGIPQAKHRNEPTSQP